MTSPTPITDQFQLTVQDEVDDYGTKASDCPGCVLYEVADSGGRRAFMAKAVVADVVSVQQAGESSFEDYRTFDNKEKVVLAGLAGDVMTGIAMIAPHPVIVGAAAGFEGIALYYDPSPEAVVSAVAGGLGGVVKGADDVTGNAIEAGAVVVGNRENIQQALKDDPED